MLSWLEENDQEALLKVQWKIKSEVEAELKSKRHRYDFVLGMVDKKNLKSHSLTVDLRYKLKEN